MKRWFWSVAALFLFGLFLLPGSAQAVRVGEPQRVATGGSSQVSMYVDDAGGLWTWGNNSYGRAGVTCYPKDDPEYSLLQESCYPPAKILDDVAWVACGRDFGAAIKNDGTLWMWGRNDVGQLGSLTRSNRGYGFEVPYTRQGYYYRYQDEPTLVMSDVAAISCAGRSVAVIKTDGTLWTWGDNSSDQLGNGGKGLSAQGSISSRRYQPTPTQILEDVSAVSLSTSGGAAIKTDGTLWTWGYGQQGQLLDGNLDSSSGTPIQVGEGYRDVLFSSTCAAIKDDGSLWAWGRAEYGCLNGDTHAGNRRYNDKRCQTEPMKLMDNVAQVYGGDTFMAALTADGEVWAWGYANWGDPGAGDDGPTSGSSHAPIKVLENVSQLSATYRDILALCQDGTLCNYGDPPTRYCYDPLTGETGRLVRTSANAYRTPAYLPMEQLFPSASTPEPVSQPEPRPEPQPVEITTSGVDPQDAGVAHPALQTLELQDEHVELSGYALHDGAGGVTTYVRVRDLARLLNGTAAQFDVRYDGHIALTANAPYTTPNAAEYRTPFQGDWDYQRWDDPTVVNGQSTALQAFVLTDAQGGGHTYYKLRDLGQVLGFNVGWSRERGMYLEPGKPYTNDD